MARKPPSRRPPSSQTPPSKPDTKSANAPVAPTDALSEALDKKIGDLFPPQQREEVVNRVYQILVKESFTGPIPHPGHLERYQALDPTAADRLIKMAEKAQDHAMEVDRHNMSLDGKVIEAQIADEKRGLNYGAGLLAVCIACALVCALTGNNWAAGLFLGVTVIGAIGQFVTRRKTGNNGASPDQPNAP